MCPRNALAEGSLMNQVALILGRFAAKLAVVGFEPGMEEQRNSRW